MSHTKASIYNKQVGQKRGTERSLRYNKPATKDSRLLVLEHYQNYECKRQSAFSPKVYQKIP